MSGKGNVAGKKHVRITDKQRRFCEAYVATGSKVGAVRAAYDVSANKNVQSIHGFADRLLADPKIQAYIDTLKPGVEAKLVKEFDVRVERIAQELAAIAFFDPIDLFNERGDLLEIHAMPERARRCIDVFETSVHVIDKRTNEVEIIKKIRFHSKTKALDTLAKWKKMLIDRKEVGAPGDFDQMTDAQLEAELAELETRNLINRAKAASDDVVHKGRKVAPSAGGHGRK